MCGCGGTCNQGLKKRECRSIYQISVDTETIYVNDSRLLEISVLCRYISAINSKILTDFPQKNCKNEKRDYLFDGRGRKKEERKENKREKKMGIRGEEVSSSVCCWEKEEKEDGRKSSRQSHYMREKASKNIYCDY